MILWLRAHRTLWWAAGAILAATIAGLIGTWNLPALYLLYSVPDGAPIRNTLPGIVAACLVASTYTHTPHAEAASAVNYRRLELTTLAATSSVACVSAEVLHLLTSAEPSTGLFTRNCLGLLGVALLVRGLAGPILGALTPLLWMITALTFGTPTGGVALSWPLSPLQDPAAYGAALILLVLGVTVGTGRRAVLRQ